MFSSITIKQKLWGLGCLSLAFVMAIAAAGYWGQEQMRRSMLDTAVSSAALKNQMHADMMHDALRADVLAALLAGQKPEAERTEDAKRIVDDLKEHAGLFREGLAENERLPLNDVLKKKYSRQWRCAERLHPVCGIHCFAGAQGHGRGAGAIPRVRSGV